MLVVYESLTKNVERFVNKLPYNCCHISQYDGSSPFVLVTYTINFGEIPKTVKSFMDNHFKNCLGVSSSGNKNWGSYYGLAGNKISTIYNVPLISKFELQGTEKDVKIFIERVEDIVKMDRT